MKLRDVFAVIEAVSENAEGKRLGFRNGLVACGAVAENAGQIGYFSDPAPVIFLFDIDCELAHRRDSTPPSKRAAPRCQIGASPVVQVTLFVRIV